MKLRIAFDRDELNKLQYPIIVERWDRVMDSGSGKRKFNERFTEHERETIHRYRPILYGWYMRTGTPEEYTMNPLTYAILQRAVEFFATV